MLNELFRHRQGSIAIEFALVAPIFLLLLLGISACGVAFSIASGVQQLASEAARASVGGLNDGERKQIVQTFIQSHIGSYPFVLPDRLTIDAASLGDPGTAFQVSLSYDLGRQVSAMFGSIFPMPAQVRRSAVVAVSTGL